MESECPFKLGRQLTKVRANPFYSYRLLTDKMVAITLTVEYDLDKSGKTQPPVNIDDVLFITYNLLAQCDIAFPTSRALFQLNTLRKIMTSTSARPGTLIEFSGHMRANDALKWKDIELYIPMIHRLKFF
jgi:hypothetical protein